VPWTAETVLAAVDGLVLTGGPDLGPSHYGADRHPQTGPSRPERDAWEIELCRASLSADLPLLAICRGLQVLNVCAGGDLHQHLPDVVGHDGHRATPGQMSPVHITFTPDSRVAALMGSATVGQCHHHQAVDRLGQGLEAVGFADDGTVEAVERPGQSFAVAVQWHPEDDGSGDRLFAALVGAAAQRRSTRLGGTDDHLAGAGRP
jgi:gamma-glutamyl-gamma-aminobutyrate hydrolase PuuD